MLSAIFRASFDSNDTPGAITTCCSTVCDAAFLLTSSCDAVGSVSVVVGADVVLAVGAVLVAMMLVDVAVVAIVVVSGVSIVGKGCCYW